MKRRVIITGALIVVVVFGLYSVANKKHDDSLFVPPEPNEATLITYEHLPSALHDVLTEEDVALILDLEFVYMKKAGLTRETPPAKTGENEPGPDLTEMAKFIVAEAAKKQKSFTTQAVIGVLEAENAYLRMEGNVEE
jgi:hypothetical protein